MNQMNQMSITKATLITQQLSEGCRYAFRQMSHDPVTPIEPATDKPPAGHHNHHQRSKAT
jgi:hypothetical protein